MARLKIGEIEAIAGRTVDYDAAIYEGDGRTALNIAADDKVRFKLADTENGTPTLDIVSGTPTANGSTVTISGTTPGTCTVRLAQGDTSTLSGTKYWELILIDNSETSPADAAKTICYGTMVFKPSMGGSIGL